MKKETPVNRFITASEKMTSAWKKIVEAGQIDLYRNLPIEEFEGLKKKKISKIPENKRNIREYIKALDDFLSLSNG